MLVARVKVSLAQSQALLLDVRVREAKDKQVSYTSVFPWWRWFSTRQQQQAPHYHDKHSFP